MRETLTVEDALNVIARTALPTVMTEGLSDYQVMRRVEERLRDLNIDFLPLGGKDKVLQVWRELPAAKRHSTIAIVDLDLWIYSEIPPEFQGAGLMYTTGYSIENDIFLDAELIGLCDLAERNAFERELRHLCSWHAREIDKALSGQRYCISDHPAVVLAQVDILDQLSPSERALRSLLERYYGQILRGKTLIELLARQLNKPNRYAKFGYKQLFELGSSRLGPRLTQLEKDIRTYFLADL